MGNNLINKSAIVFKIMSYDCLGIIRRTYWLHLFTKKDFESEVERRKEEKRKETEE